MKAYAYNNSFLYICGIYTSVRHQHLIQVVYIDTVCPKSVLVVFLFHR